MPLLSLKDHVLNWLKDCRENDTQNISNTELANRIGVTKQAVGKWFATGRISTDNLLRISEIYNYPLPLVFDEINHTPIYDINRGSKESNSTQLNGNEVCVPFFQEITLPDDPSRHQIIKNNDLKLHLTKSTLEKQNIAIDCAFGAYISGNSMEPVLPNGTTIGIDASRKSLIDGDLFAIDHHGDLRVKMLYRIPGGGIRLKSYNSEEHPDEVYSSDESKNITILGRIFYWTVIR